MEKIDIRNRFTGELILEKEYEDDLDLSNTDLSYADLRDILLANANLSNANLSYVNLSYGDLRGANLEGANLNNADLNHTDLRNANLSCTNLRDANLKGAFLKGADLSNADLYCANLRYAYLINADLSNVNLECADLYDSELDDNELIRKGYISKGGERVYKRCEGKIIELELLDGSIVFSINNYKCRTNKAKVISIDGDYTIGKILSSVYDGWFDYKVGEIIEVEDFDLMYNVEYAKGIHFFFSREDAENYRVV